MTDKAKQFVEQYLDEWNGTQRRRRRWGRLGYKTETDPAATYKCQNCGLDFTERDVLDIDLMKCPSCGSSRVKQQRDGKDLVPESLHECSGTNRRRRRWSKKTEKTGWCKFCNKDVVSDGDSRLCPYCMEPIEG
jgi:DNA-directed RNA polymerase subunit RPC12/RpoP